MSTKLTPAALDPEILKDVVFDITGATVTGIDILGRDDFCRRFRVRLQNETDVVACVLGANLPVSILESEVSTLRYLRDRTSIPVSRVLAFETDRNHPLGPYMLTDEPPGVCLDAVFPGLAPFEQDSVVAQIAKWTVELFHHHFDAIGSIYAGDEDGYRVGRIVRPAFFLDGRSNLPLDLGPYGSAQAYLLSCAQREIDYSTTLFSQSTSPEYQRDLADSRLRIEHSMMLLTDLIHKCPGLDNGDSDLSPFSLDLHELVLKNFYVSKEDASNIISVAGWNCVCTKPLWQCGRLPRWLIPSLSEGDDDKARLSAVFRNVIVTEEGADSPFVRAIDNEDIRCVLHDLCDYDAFKDGFLLQPALESLAATLPGDEDIEGLSALLDPSTTTGRVARISLLTSGSAGDTLSLAS